MRALALIGALFIFSCVIGAVVPGAAFHVYFGTEEGAAKWHRQILKGKEGATND